MYSGANFHANEDSTLAKIHSVCCRLGSRSVAVLGSRAADRLTVIGALISPLRSSAVFIASYCKAVAYLERPLGDNPLSGIQIWFLAGPCQVTYRWQNTLVKL